MASGPATSRRAPRVCFVSRTVRCFAVALSSALFAFFLAGIMAVTTAAIFRASLANKWSPRNGRTRVLWFGARAAEPSLLCSDRPSHLNKS